MLRWLTGLLFLLALTPGASAQFVIDGAVPAWGIDFDEVHRALSNDLRDPRSAQYKGLVLVPNDTGAALCGWMNWRGDEGAYGPFVAFYYKAATGGVREAFVSELGLDDEMSDRMAAAGCFTSVVRAGL